jgi:hypothetical protein
MRGVQPAPSHTSFAVSTFSSRALPDDGTVADRNTAGAALILVGFFAVWLIFTANSCAAAAATADILPSNEPTPFVREWRAVMSTGEAKLLPYAGTAFKIERRRISTAQLDALEARLLPVLAAELKSVGSRNPPSSYFRQYAAARSGKHQLILVHGFLRDTGHSIDWTRKPADAGDRGDRFWDAVYVVKRHRFVKLKRDKDAVRHTVIFQHAA